jgi:hypothetical protein
VPCDKLDTVGVLLWIEMAAVDLEHESGLRLPRSLLFALTLMFTFSVFMVLVAVAGKLGLGALIGVVGCHVCVSCC